MIIARIRALAVRLEEAQQIHSAAEANDVAEELERLLATIYATGMSNRNRQPAICAMILGWAKTLR